MKTGRGQAEHHVAGLDGRAVHDAVPLDDADGEAREVVLARRVEIGQFRRLPADERATRAPAAVGHAAHDRLDARGVELADADVVQEIQRLRAVDEQVVDAHGNEVDADRVVPVGEERDLQLGAHTVGGRHQHRLVVAARNAHERREGADAAEDLGAERRLRQRRDTPDRFVAGLDIDSGVAIRMRLHRLRRRRGGAAAWGRARCRPCRRR